ncbi:MAG: ThuA domain-containing protein [Candidatus Hydrogenedentes bacterium]|nr:ThuA domain-containing protein [Candidatus Hydrogenedentota bacterium]
MKRVWIYSAVVAAASVCGCATRPGVEWNSLFLSKSEGFQHSCIEQKDGKPSHVDKILTGLFAEQGGKVLCTKDADLINAENLKKYKLVVFYTQGNICNMGDKDKGKIMGPNGVADLIAWVKNGGGYLGFHCASDTFHTSDAQPNSPYLEMVGGEFRGHGKQFKGTLRVVDTKHPAMVHIPQDFQIYDEIYTFKNYNRKSMHVLAMWDSGEERKNPDQNGRYDMPNFPIIWCSQVGKGRVYFNALGHREDVWENPVMQRAVVDAANWAMGKGPADAAPNFDKVVPAADVVKIETHVPTPPPPAAPAAPKK